MSADADASDARLVLCSVEISRTRSRRRTLFYFRPASRRPARHDCERDLCRLQYSARALGLPLAGDCAHDVRSFRIAILAIQEQFIRAMLPRIGTGWNRNCSRRVEVVVWWDSFYLLIHWHGVWGAVLALTMLSITAGLVYEWVYSRPAILVRATP